MEVCIFQTGEPLHIDKGNYRPMRCMLLADNLIENGHKVKIISSAFFHQRKIHRTRKFKIYVINENLSIYLIPSIGYTKHISLRRVLDHLILALNLSLFLKINKDFCPDKLFIGYPPILSSFVMAFWCKKNNIPYMLDVKDKWPEIFLEPFSKNIKAIVRIFLEPYYLCSRYIFKNANQITSITDEYINWIKNTYKDNQNQRKYFVSPLIRKPLSLNYIQNKIATNFWGKQNINVLKTKYFCFIGSYSKSFDFDFIYKSAELLIKKYPKVKFIICGSGDQYENVKNKFENSPNVFVFGEIDKYNAKILIKNSLATLAPYLNNPNFRDHIPNKIIESLENNTPFITTVEGKLKSIIDEFENGIFIKNKESIDLSAYEKLILDSEHQQYLSINAGNSYKKLFDYKKTFQKIIKIIEIM